MRRVGYAGMGFEKEGERRVDEVNLNLKEMKKERGRKLGVSCEGCREWIGVYPFLVQSLSVHSG